MTELREGEALVSAEMDQESTYSLLRLCATNFDWKCSDEEFERWIAAHDAAIGKGER